MKINKLIISVIIASVILSIQFVQMGYAQTVKGDLNNDSKVDIIDLGILLSSWGRIDKPPADLNQDGKVDVIDLGILLSNWGKTTPPVNIPFRAFSNDSYWNKPFPSNAPIDPNNAKYIADSQNPANTQNFLQFTAAPGTLQDFGEPIYWASTNDPQYTIIPSMYGKTIQTKIPKGATPMSGSDGGLIVYDLTGNVVVELWQAKYDASNDKWTAASTTRYYLNSNGLDGSVTGSDNSGNFGHRGIPPPLRAIRVDEVMSGTINHRLECFWHATAAGHYWPMAGDEGNKGGVVLEGIVIRIKPSVDLSKRGLSPPALVIAKALQEYGCMIGDNSGAGNRLKLERNETAWKSLGLTYDALSPIPWSDWEFVQGGYKP